ncbi:hypothetical protein FRC12_008054 [Ceratobasidium sp. 428]|nr:hypothetical protein FRC12_008054 [Ceratobasidium sp. 428]
MSCKREDEALTNPRTSRPLHLDNPTPTLPHATESTTCGSTPSTCHAPSDGILNPKTNNQTLPSLDPRDSTHRATLTSAAQPAKGRETKRITWSGLKKLAGKLDNYAGVFGPLRSVTSEFYEFLGAVETEAKARTEYVRLESEIDTLFDEISSLVGDSMPPAMTACVANLVS